MPIEPKGLNSLFHLVFYGLPKLWEKIEICLFLSLFLSFFLIIPGMQGLVPGLVLWVMNPESGSGKVCVSYQRALAVVWDNAPAGLSGADGELEGGAECIFDCYNCHRLDA